MAQYFNGAYGARDMALNTMTEGISVEGMRNFHDTLKAKLLTGVSEKLEETGEIETALKEGWQGQSRDVFLEQFSNGIKSVKNDLSSEYNDLMRKLGELMDSYFDQDKKMMDLIIF